MPPVIGGDEAPDLMTDSARVRLPSSVAAFASTRDDDPTRWRVRLRLVLDRVIDRLGLGRE